MRYMAAVILFCVLLPLMCFSVELVIGDEQDEKEAKITSLEVMNMSYRGGNRQGRMQITVTVKRREGDIVSIQTESSKISTMTDDKGGNLMEQAQMLGWGTAVSRTAKGISPDGSCAAMDFMVMSLPSEGAKRVNATGKIVLTTGNLRGVAREKGLALEKDAMVKAGDSVIKVIEAVKSEDGKTTTVSFSCEGLPRAVTGMEFFDSLGNRIEKTQSDNSVVAMQPNGTGSTRFSYVFTGTYDKVDVKIDYWKTTRDVEIDFDLSTNLGLRGK